MAAVDKENVEFWRAISTGDFVSLSDPEAFAAGMAGGSSGVDYTVGDIRSFSLSGPEGAGPAEPGRFHRARRVTQSSLGEYRFIELQKEGSGPLYLALVEQPPAFELRLYFIPSGLEPGTRDELIDRGDTWLFLPPADPEDFISSELEYAPYPDVPEIDEGGVGRKYVFSRIGPSSLFCESLDTRSSVMITEYQASPQDNSGAPQDSGTPEPANPLLLVLEEGWMRRDGSQSEEGGYITVMLGKVMRASDLDYYPTP